MKNAFRPLLLILSCVSLWGCASYPLNDPIEEINSSAGYRLENLPPGPGNSDDLYVILALSGGGARAAALDFGVMQQLDRVRFGDDRRSLLDEVDMISSSSGASIPAAYYGIYGKEVFLRDFTEDVLYRQIQTALKWRTLNPWHWPRLLSGTFSRGDLFAEYFDETIYDGHTFADMPLQRPLILLNATDIGIGSQFSFTQGSFDLICSDLSTVKVARGVTASMAFTPAFTPITLKNYNDGRCGDNVPAWVYRAIESGVEDNPSVFAAADDILSYTDIERRPYIHLLDSGISDNIGIRTPALAFSVRDAPASQVDRIEDGAIKKLVVIIVNARPKSSFKGDLSPKPPGAAASITASASRPLANYSYETVNLIRRNIADARSGLSEYYEQRSACSDHAEEVCANGTPAESCVTEVEQSCFEKFDVADDQRPPELDIFLIHLSFDLIDDISRRERFETIPTTLQLPIEDVDALVELAPELLQTDPEFQLLLEDLDAEYTE